MEITEVRVKLLTGRSDRLRAFCSITFDDEFVVHDLRVIDGRKGLFVAMPSRKLTDKCPACGGKNHLRASYCCECGGSLKPDRAKGRDKYHVDVAHPIKTSCREKIKDAVLAAYKEELEERGILKEEIDGEEEPQEAEEEYTEDDLDEAAEEEMDEDHDDDIEDVEDNDLDWDDEAEEGDVIEEAVEEEMQEEEEEEEYEYEEDDLEDEVEEEKPDKKSGGFGEGIL